MKLPPNVFFRSDLRLMIFRPRGILNEKRVNTVIEFLEEAEQKTEHPFNRFSDLSKLDAVDLDFRYVFQIALHRRLSYAHRLPVKSAFYTPNEATERIVRVHALVTDQSPLRVEMFKKLAPAAEWLGVSEKDIHFEGR